MRTKARHILYLSRYEVVEYQVELEQAAQEEDLLVVVSRSVSIAANGRFLLQGHKIMKKGR